MIILSHRGLWPSRDEGNSLAAFRHSFEAGFGVELDVRDQAGRVVVAHDPPDASPCLAFDEVLALRRTMAPEVELAINIKACGLAQRIAEALRAHHPERCFVFDMAVPDALSYLSSGLRAFTRQSEIEMSPSFYPRASGVWIDAFEQEWADEQVIDAHLEAGKEVCLVSPELHQRPHGPFWQRLRDPSTRWGARVSLCTDHPHEASAFFRTAA